MNGNQSFFGDDAVDDDLHQGEPFAEIPKRKGNSTLDWENKTIAKAIMAGTKALPFRGRY